MAAPGGGTGGDWRLGGAQRGFGRRGDGTAGGRVGGWAACLGGREGDRRRPGRGWSPLPLAPCTLGWGAHLHARSDLCSGRQRRSAQLYVLLRVHAPCGVAGWQACGERHRVDRRVRGDGGKRRQRRKAGGTLVRVPVLVRWWGWRGGWGGCLAGGAVGAGCGIILACAGAGRGAPRAPHRRSAAPQPRPSA